MRKRVVADAFALLEQRTLLLHASSFILEKDNNPKNKKENVVLKASATHPASRMQQLSSATLVEHTHAHTACPASLSLLRRARGSAASGHIEGVIRGRRGQTVASRSVCAVMALLSVLLG
jgi:hypothetical protein